MPVISCDGASPIVGCVYVGPLNGSPRTSVYLNDKLLGLAEDKYPVWGTCPNGS